MTRAELVNKIVRFAGVPESEAKVFMELFLRKLSSILGIDDSFVLPGIGSIRLRTLRPTFMPHSILPSDVLVFTTDYFFGEEVNELVFGILSTFIEEAAELDSCFSISIGKPVIPLRVEDKTEMYTLYSGSEAKFLLDSKIDKLLQKGEFIKITSLSKEEKISDADKIKVPAEFTDNSEPLAQINLFSDEYEGRVPWDFGEDWQKEYDEVDFEVRTPAHSTQFDGKDFDLLKATWDFGSAENEIEEEGNDSTYEEELLIEEEQAINLDSEEQSSEVESFTLTQEFWQSINDDDIDEILGNKSEELEDSPSPGFKPVKSLTRDLDIDISELLTPDEEVESEPTNYWDKLSNTKEDDGFVEVKKTSEDFLLENFYEGQENIEDEKDERQPKVGGVSDSSLEQKPGTAEELADKKIPSSTSEESVRQKDVRSVSRKSKSLEQTKSRSFKGVVVLVSVLILLSVTAYYYYQKYGMPNWLPFHKEVLVLTAKSEAIPVVIERDFEIPVNYPYSKREDAASISHEQSVDVPIVNEAPVIEKTKPFSPQIETEVSDMFSKRNPGNILNQRERASSKQQVIEEKPLPEFKPKERTAEKPVPEFKPKERTAGKPVPESKPKERTAEVVKKISENIFQDGTGFAVQVSSWRQKAKAQSEVTRYLNSGYKAYLMEAELPGRGTWYRVRVGGFNSLQEAEKFLTQNR